MVAAIKEDGVHWVAPSLYLQVRQEQGTRSWLFRYSRAGENQWVGLGALADKQLTEARDEAAMLKVQVKRGGDPIADKRQIEALSKPRTKIPTFAECATGYIESHRDGWKNDKHAAQWPSTIRMYVNPVIGKLPVDQVSVEHVLRILKPIWTTLPETASRVRSRIELTLGWASAMGYRSGENPAQWKGAALSHLLPPISKVRTVEHHKAVPYKDVPALMAELRQNDSMSARALMFTVSRKGLSADYHRPTGLDDRISAPRSPRSRARPDYGPDTTVFDCYPISPSIGLMASESGKTLVARSRSAMPR